jgi:hypothetical protein
MQEYKNQRFTKTIKANLGNLYDLLQEEKALLAGGAVTSLFCNREINDWDIYCPSKWSVARVMVDAFEDNNSLNSYELLVSTVTKKSVMARRGHKTKTEETLIQFITFDYFKSAEEPEV